MHRLRHEYASTGFDDHLQLVGGDGAGTPEGSGLRVPNQPGFRYRFLCASVDLLAGDTIIGIRQAVELWGYPTSDEETNFSYPFRLLVTNPFWHFIDGFITWTLTTESTPPPDHHYSVDESRSFAFEDSNAPALLFESVLLGSPPQFPGYLGLVEYTPPGIKGTSELTLRDLRYLSTSNAADQNLRIEADGALRARLYCDVLQTDPSTRVQPGHVGGFLGDEDAFATQTFPNTAVYGLVFGSIQVASPDRRRR